MARVIPSASVRRGAGRRLGQPHRVAHPPEVDVLGDVGRPVVVGRCLRSVTEHRRPRIAPGERLEAVGAVAEPEIRLESIRAPRRGRRPARAPRAGTRAGRIAPSPRSTLSVGEPTVSTQRKNVDSRGSQSKWRSPNAFMPLQIASSEPVETSITRSDAVGVAISRPAIAIRDDAGRVVVGTRDDGPGADLDHRGGVPGADQGTEPVRGRLPVRPAATARAGEPRIGHISAGLSVRDLDREPRAVGDRSGSPGGRSGRSALRRGGRLAPSSARRLRARARRPRCRCWLSAAVRGAAEGRAASRRGAREGGGAEPAPAQPVPAKRGDLGGRSRPRAGRGATSRCRGHAWPRSAPPRPPPRAGPPSHSAARRSPAEPRALDRRELGQPGAREPRAGPSRIPGTADSASTAQGASDGSSSVTARCRSEEHGVRRQDLREGVEGGGGVGGHRAHACGPLDGGRGRSLGVAGRRALIAPPRWSPSSHEGGGLRRRTADNEILYVWICLVAFEFLSFPATPWSSSRSSASPTPGFSPQAMPSWRSRPGW